MSNGILDKYGLVFKVVVFDDGRRFSNCNSEDKGNGLLAQHISVFTADECRDAIDSIRIHLEDVSLNIDEVLNDATTLKLENGNAIIDPENAPYHFSLPAVDLELIYQEWISFVESK